ncbi:L-fucose:H+ symporter permease [Mucilaginibacter ginsenosidivorans]|uniref:L-fucose:H+ symporter permease n=1 Tax=Mucilaginibacter ginsenosidivorans TaxID=398053 RepID=A0A5B8USZ4_9SPHI|nr:L-fucose:H+ symporter permease [Mucilaginibacter ginsenosidivorans]
MRIYAGNLIVFLWGFSNNLNPILIPHLKKSFTLTTTQSTLVDSAVYIAYFLMALPAGYVMKRFGYKIGIITGLIFFSIGAFLFIPAANTQSYLYFLFALFVIACGLGFLETAANPYAAALGPHETRTQRLNLAQSFNGLAAALAPVIGARVILGQGYTEQQLNAMSSAARQVALASEASSVKTPYFILGTVLLVIAIAFTLTKLPAIQHKETGKEKSQNILHAFKHKHLTWSVIAQFFYVGAQVCVFSLFVLYAGKSAGLSEMKAADYLGACGIAFLIGRFFGTFLMRYIKPNKLLTIYASINILLCMVAIGANGMITIYAVILICFFMSVMFPTIFALGIADLGGDTEYGSSLLIMSIVGGAILPRVFGIISDSTGDIQIGYLVPLFCFSIVAYFGWKGHKTVPEVVFEEGPAIGATL